MHAARALAATAALAAASTLALSAGTASADPDPRSSYSFAVIGDVPYGDTQIAKFPGWIQQINRDPVVRSVVHLGDIKNGSSRCTDAYFDLIRSDFDTFEDPLVYTPGDNEWTDCHRVNNGAYNPLERLDRIRQVFFDAPGKTLGIKQMPVEAQADFDTFEDPLVYTPGDNEWTDCHRVNNGAYNPLERLDRIRQVFFDEPGRTLGQKQLNVEAQAGFPENVVYHRAEVTFVAANVPGSDNGLQPWSGLGNTAATPEQVQAVADRTAADIAIVRQAFAEARDRGDRGVVIMQQADMFDPTYVPTWNDIGAFQPWIQAIVDEASAFDGPVYLMDGDSHVYNTDKPLAAGSPWLATYDVTGSADNLTRVTVDGSSNNNDWLRVTINKPGAASLLSWERVPYAD